MFHWSHKHQIWSNSITMKGVVLQSAPRPESAVGGVSYSVETSENVDLHPLKNKRRRGKAGEGESKNI